MKSADISQFLVLRKNLLAERARLQARLQEIAAALDGAAGAPAKATRGGKRVFSAATKAKMAASQRARWAAKLAGKSPAPAAATEAKPKARRKLSAEGRAKIIAAAKARWAKLRAAKAKTGAGGK